MKKQKLKNKKTLMIKMMNQNQHMKRKFVWHVGKANQIKCCSHVGIRFFVQNALRTSRKNSAHGAEKK